MAQISHTERFPGSGDDIARPALKRDESSYSRRRRKSSSLPGDPRGDTGGASLSTYSDNPPPEGPKTSFLRTPSERARPQSKRRKAKSLFRQWKSMSLRHTWVNPLIVVLAVIFIYLVKPGPQSPVRAAIFLSYPLSRADPLAEPQYRLPYWRDTTQYGKGGQDFAFVAFYTVVLSFVREFLMQRLIRPMAIRAGIKSRAKQSRFMEQTYTAMYFAVFGPYGLYVMYRSPVWYFNSLGMFEGFPHRSHEGIFKTYYLLQASYWSQQAIVLLLQLEKPRKDFKELVGHHVITLALIWCSYRFHFTYMGLAVYITHDISDFFLATSKILNYLSHPIVGPYFSLFIFVWAYTRHYLNLAILYATATTFRTVGPFELNWETQQYKCWIAQYITFALLAAIQGLNIFWFFLILRIAYNFVVTSHVDDVRSEDEGSEDGQDGGNTAPGAQEDRETTAQKRARFGLEDPPDAQILAEAPSPAGSTRSKTNGHAIIPQEHSRSSHSTATTSSDDTPTGSGRRRKAAAKS